MDFPLDWIGSEVIVCGEQVPFIYQDHEVAACREEVVESIVDFFIATESIKNERMHMAKKLRLQDSPSGNRYLVCFSND